jgi:prepilin-type N-terminal cleavage/methylation domain-containing protein
MQNNRQYAVTTPMTYNKTNRAFTLIELLVVMAITALLLTLTVAPLVTAFNLTSRASTLIESQTTARNVTADIRLALSNAVFVFNNNDTPINLWVREQTAGSGYQTQGAPRAIPLQYGVIDYVAPARQLDQTPGQTPIDPTTGKPTYLGVDKERAGYAFPLSPGINLGRFFIALADNRSRPDVRNPIPAGQSGGTPIKPYANRHSDPATVGADADNRATLYKAEVLAYIPDPQNPNSNARIPNLKLFHTVDANGNVVDTKNGELRRFDPNFFYDNSLAGAEGSKGDKIWAETNWVDLNGDGLVQISENWKAVSSSMLALNKADAIALTRREDGKIEVVNADGTPLPDGETGIPQARSLALFMPGYVENAPAVPISLENAGNESPNPAPTTFTADHIFWTTPYRVLVYRGNSATDDPMTQNPLTYFEATGIPGYGIRLNGASADLGPNPDPDRSGVWVNPDGTLRNPAQQFAFGVDPRRGLIGFAYSNSVMLGVEADMMPGAPRINPLAQRYDPAVINANLDGPWEGRYIDLRAPLDSRFHPPSAQSPLSPNLPWFGTVRIVPGSERIFGPDQRPGSTYGSRVLYTRVPANTGTPGLNEYRINYEDVPNAIAADPNDPRVRMGYVEFCRDPNAPLPTSVPVEIYYEFQMNRPNDVIKIDYLTRELLTISLEARLYDQATGAPQIAALTEVLKVRNLQK